MFRITQGRGFQITFDNGYTVSVQFGTGNYCDNRSLKPWAEGVDISAGEEGCGNAEIAAWGNRAEDWYRPACLGPMVDDVYGYATPEQVAAVIAEVSALPPVR